MRVLDLFSGIGGIALGLERAGMETTAFCECEPYCRRVLSLRWPHVPCFPDVRALRGQDVGTVDLIAGGFPCQDISLAGKGAGLAGERSGLFYEIVRLATEIRPRWLFLENVAALRSRGLESVLGELSALGYDAQWHCVPASALGAPHRRDRVWIVARHAGCQGQPALPQHDEASRLQGDVPDAERQQLREQPGRGGGADGEDAPQPGEHGAARPVADPIGQRLAFWQGFGRHLQREFEAAQRAHRAFGWWSVEPPVGRVADGVPSRVDRIRALGNAVVPAIPEMIGRAIMAAEHGA